MNNLTEKIKIDVQAVQQAELVALNCKCLNLYR